VHRKLPLGRSRGAFLLAALVVCSGQAKAESHKNFRPIFANGQLIAAAAVITDPPYNADPGGAADASSAIQRAMGDVSRDGGGTVFLPAGRYRLDKPLTMPATVTLCGEWRKPVPGQPLSGTILLAYAGKGNAAGPALISPPDCGHANIYNLTIYYPEQSAAHPAPYPFSIEGRVAYVHGITLVNSYQGILMSVFSGGNVSDVYGTVLQRGIVLKGSSELCSCYHVRLSSDYWARLPEAKLSARDAEGIRKSMADHLVGVQTGKLDGCSFYDADLAAAHLPVLVKIEDDEQKYMVAPRSQYGFGGGMAKVRGARTEIEGAWYFGTHYFDLDNYPDLAGKTYSFAPERVPARLGPDSTYQASGFGVKADGITDDTAALQSALDRAGGGGGTVLLPRGVVLLDAPITVPPGVELRGGMQAVVVRPWYNVCTIMIASGADTPDPGNAQAAINLEKGAGLRGVCVSHAKNFWETDAHGALVMHPYPYAVRCLGSDAYIQDVTITNAYNGIDLGQARCDRSQVVNLWGAMFNDGIRVGAQSDSVRLQNINIDVGVLGDFRLRQFPAPPDAEKRRLWGKYLDDHCTEYLFGDCTNLETFDLAGFAPHRFMEFIDQGHGGCRDARFWSSIFDVPQVETARFRGGGKIAFYGLFATGGRDHHSLWAEFDPAFKGSVDVFGLCQQLTFNNRPYEAGPEELRIHLEHSLTTGRPVAASSSEAGFPPAQAVDGDPRTMWKSADGPGPHLLTVQLAAPSVITRWRVHNGGNYLGKLTNTAEAELQGSMDGAHYTKLAEFHNNAADWVDLPVQSSPAVRFVRLAVGSGPGSAGNHATIAAFDVFGHAVK
jgi:hypothetical protein